MAVKVIAIAAAKGGPGKSVITTALAAYAAKGGDRVAMLDAEPQKSLTLWWERRGSPESPKAFEADDPRDVARMVGKLKADKHWNWILIDSPPALIERIDEIVKAADFVLIPVRASIFDVEAIAPVVEMARDYSRPYAFVMSQADPKWKLLGATIEALEDFGPVLAEHVRYRAAYASALTVGKTGPEAADSKQAAECREEIAALWRAVKKRAG